MVKVKLIYNPYLLKTELSVQGTAITKDSSLAFIFDKLLNKWLGVSGAWRGFFLELADAVGIPKKLTDLGIPQTAVPGMAKAAMEVQRLLKNNPREVTEQDARDIYNSLY